MKLTLTLSDDEERGVCEVKKQYKGESLTKNTLRRFCKDVETLLRLEEGTK